MFGGLEIKDKASGGGGSTQDGGYSSEPSAPAATATAAGSAFGFMNNNSSSATAAPSHASSAEPGPAVSSFSFLNSTAPSIDAAEGTKSTTTTTTTTSIDAVPAASAAMGATSGFPFVQHLSTAPTETPDDEAEDPAPAAPTAASAFSFMMPSASTDVADETAVAVAANNTTSGFSFLSSPSPAVTIEEISRPEEPDGALELLTGGIGPPKAVHARTMSIGSNASSITNDIGQTTTNFLESVVPPPTTATTFLAATPTPPGLPTGSGVTFGTSGVKRNVVKKKNRAQRVGAGAAVASNAAVNVPMSPVPAPAVPTPQSKSAPVADESKSARDAASEAQRRAEEFMLAKERQEAEAEKKASAFSSSSPHAIQPSASTDDVLAAAQAAAEEAKILQQKQQKGGGGGFMGTFFKGFGSGGVASRTTSSTTVESNGSHHGSKNKEIPDGLGVDRLAREQEGMQRAMAERQMQIQKSIQSNDDDVENDDDVVVVSTSAGRYRPDLVAESQSSATRPSTFTPATIPTTKSGSEIASETFGLRMSSSFAPAKPAFGVVATHPPISVQKSKTPTMIFEECQSTFAQSVKRAMAQVENVRSQQKMLTEERFVSIAKDRLATQQIEHAESQLQAAVEEENYELADQLGQVIDGHKREKQEVALMLENIAKALAQLDSQKSSVVKSVAKCFDDLTLQLSELKDKEAAAEQKDDEETLKQFALISKQLSAEQERLAQDLKHLERDEKLVAEERKELEDSISEQTGEIEIRKEGASQKLKDVENEIAELRKLLERKQKEAADLRTEMFGFEDAISKVRVKFSRQLTRVDKKERSLKESRSEWEAEDSAHKKQKEAHELQVQSHSEALLAHDALLKALDSELKLSKDFSELIPKQLGFSDKEKTDRTDELEDADNESDLAQLQADVVKCEAAVSEAKILLKAAVSALTSLQTEHESLTALIPELEAQKIAAASSRDFKAAGKASKDIKDATTRIKECEDELNGEALSRKTSAEENLQKLESELAEAREIANAKEKVSGIEKMVNLAKQIGKLLETKKEVCGESAADENSVRGVGALVLDMQIAALKSVGQDIGDKYGGWSELMSQHGLDEPDLQEVCDDSANLSQIAEPKPRPDDGLTFKERVSKVRQLMERLTAAEVGMEEAAEKEDFEEAAKHQETLELIQKEIEDMNLTDEEVELAMSDEPIPEEEEDKDKLATEKGNNQTQSDTAMEAIEEDNKLDDDKIDELATEKESNLTKPDAVMEANEEGNKLDDDKIDDDVATKESEDDESPCVKSTDTSPEETVFAEDSVEDEAMQEEEEVIEANDVHADELTDDSKSMELSAGDTSIGNDGLDAEKKEDPSTADE